ncbi:MAG: hypothetical protein E7246_07315 [Lachnoclostridium sp.]|nr:hypothetical protein [Lachnoclostridium sp.]
MTVLALSFLGSICIPSLDIPVVRATQFVSETNDHGMDQYIEEYLYQIQQGETIIEEYSTELIVDPEVQMKTGGSGLIQFILPDGNFYESSVPNGMVTERPVEMILPDGAIATVMDGTETKIQTGQFTISEPGEYQIRMVFMQGSWDENNAYAVFEVNHDVLIVNHRTNNLDMIQVPEGFKVTIFQKDGKGLEISDSQCVLLEHDGDYEIHYEDIKTGLIRLQSNLSRDTKAPFLTFSTEIDQGTIKGPLEYVPSEDGCEIIVTYNGSQGPAVGNTLTVPGYYRLEIQDEAGNSQAYEFQLRQSRNLIDNQMIIMTLIILIGVVIHIIYTRRNRKVL